MKSVPRRRCAYFTNEYCTWQNEKIEISWGHLGFVIGAEGDGQPDPDAGEHPDERQDEQEVVLEEFHYLHDERVDF